MLRSHLLAGLGASAVAVDFPPATAIVTLGVVAPFSGNDRGLGERLADGVRSAVEDANRLRAPLDRTFAVRTFDDQNNVTIALQNASFAVGDSSIVGTIGHVSSRATLAALPTYASSQMPLVAPVTTDDRLTQTNYRNVFRLQTRDTDEGRLFAKFAIADRHPKQPFVYTQDADYGADVANGFITATRDARLPTQFAQFPYANADFATVARKAIDAGADYVFLAGIVGDMGPLVTALRAQGYRGPIGAAQGFFDGRTLQLGAAANDMVISSSMPNLALAPSTITIRSTFEARYGPFQPIAAFGYAAAQVYIQTLRRVNATARNSLLAGILQGGPISTVVGTYTFSGSGDPIDPELYFYTIRDGKFAYVRQAHPSSFMIR